MKGALDRTKVVLRHLPPSITEDMLMGQIDCAFAGRYNWVSFRPGNNSQKHQLYSRIYIDFKRPEDVIEFAEYFGGHVFVNEKGTQFKTIVEYAPSQRVPKQWPKNDGREGTIFKDPEYLDFLGFLAKPVENLPSAEIQLERREAERAGAMKETPIVTPLMDYVRQKRAAKGGSRRSSSNGKPSRRAGGSSGGSPSSMSSKRGSEKIRGSTKMYVMTDSGKHAGGKDKPTYILVPKQANQQLSEKSAALTSVAGAEVGEAESGVAGKTNMGKKKVLLLKGKETETSHVSGGISQQHSVASLVKAVVGSNASRQNQRREGNVRIIRNILSKDARQSQSSGMQLEHQKQTKNLERRPPRPSYAPLVLKDTNGAVDDKVLGDDMRGCNEKQEKCTRNKNRPDRCVWTLRRSEGSHASDESLSSSASHSTQSPFDSSEGGHGDNKFHTSSARNGEIKILGSGRSSHSSPDNGSSKHVGNQGPMHSVKDADGMFGVSESKPSKRGGASGYGSHEKQVWVQKSSSGS